MPCFRFIALLFGIFLFCGMIEAASYDCQQARTAIEKMICSEDHLSQCDAELAALYSLVLHNSSDPESLKLQQRGWLKNTRNLCADVLCLTQAYANRIAELATFKKADDDHVQKKLALETEACRRIAEYANRGALKELFVPWNNIAPPGELFERLKAVADYGWGDPYYIDFDNDGILDLFVYNYCGTACTKVYLLYGKKGSKIDEIVEFEDGPYGFSFLKMDGLYYVVTGGNSLGHLWQISNESGSFRSICSYAQKKKPEITLIKGQENPLCLKVGTNDIVHIDYPSTHSIVEVPESLFWSKYVHGGLAQVDIDNDGKLDNVVPVDFDSSAGHGWQAKYIAVADETRTKILFTNLNHLLLEMLGGNGGPDMSVFVYDGVTYLDAQGREGDRMIYRINTDKAETICEFHGQVINYDTRDGMGGDK